MDDRRAMIVNTGTWADDELCDVVENTRPGHYHVIIPGRLSWELRYWELVFLDGAAVAGDITAEAAADG